MKQLTFILISFIANSVSAKIVTFESRNSTETLVFLKTIHCKFKTTQSTLMGQLKTCAVNENIDKEDYVLESTLNNSVKLFVISDNRNVKFLPRNIGKKFPNLLIFATRRCGLTVVRDHYFENMQNLEIMDLKRNKITSIASDAFKDLCSVQILNLEHNRIENLDENLFLTMVKLEFLELSSNKIKSLSPTTFKIPAGKLEKVRLKSNVCIDKWYGVTYHLNQLEADIKTNCTK